MVNVIDPVNLDAQGRFRLLALPGKGIVGFESYAESYLSIEQRPEFKTKVIPETAPLRNPRSWNAYSDLELALSQEPARSS